MSRGRGRAQTPPWRAGCWRLSSRLQGAQATPAQRWRDRVSGWPGGGSGLLQDQAFWAREWAHAQTPSHQLGAPKGPRTKSEATSTEGLSIAVPVHQLTIPKDWQKQISARTPYCRYTAAAWGRGQGDQPYNDPAARSTLVGRGSDHLPRTSSSSLFLISPSIPTLDPLLIKINHCGHHFLCVPYVPRNST